MLMMMIMTTTRTQQNINNNSLYPSIHIQPILSIFSLPHIFIFFLPWNGVTLEGMEIDSVCCVVCAGTAQCHPDMSCHAISVKIYGFHCLYMWGKDIIMD